jgi:hypothetical protein
MVQGNNLRATTLVQQLTLELPSTTCLAPRRVELQIPWRMIMADPLLLDLSQERASPRTGISGSRY